MDILDVEKNVIPLAYHSIQLLMNYELDMPEDVMNTKVVDLCLDLLDEIKSELYTQYIIDKMFSKKENE